MKKDNQFLNVFLLIVTMVISVAAIVYGIPFFNVDPGGITEPRGELSFGTTSKLGWMLTASFFALVIIFSFARRLYYKISGTNI